MISIRFKNVVVRQIKIYIQQLRLVLTGFTLAANILSACTPAETPLPIQEDTLTPSLQPTLTSTVEWFPATSTPTLMPTQAVTSTPDFRPNLGEVLLTDDFSEPNSWILGQTSSGIIALGINELTIAIAEPKAYDYSVRQDPIIGDFYLEITTSPTLCRGEDQYGLLLRMSSPGDFYRYALSCDGRVRLDRIVQGTASSPQPWTSSGAVPPGAPITARLGVWVLGDEMRFFVNDQYQFTVNDPLLTSGNLGLFARSAGETAVTVNFSDLVVRQINQ